ncbi:MAG: selenocysteine-specific translation elongation factor [Myxococcales bacterium]|nr:selenocysteine-specific translation elongation factor [Myxococcota bacterium]MDW8283163.1 selenocysteine-specific translation elongation factor [Myxococcales bacterium]
MPERIPRFVVGTAGHIDHGKTSLVRALTGIDTDRLPEEKARGITIELGFAHLSLPRHGIVGVVDVPGHERFVRTMVAGATGIDLVLLVVAADEGVMPQTREHLDICSLLGVRRGLVALTKCDLVDADMRELAALEVRETLRGGPLQDAPIVPCSAVTGEGMAELVATLDRLLDGTPARDPDLHLRLPVDRVFTVKGFGTVATGTLWGGRLRVGDELVPQPPGAPRAKVRGLQVHGQPVEEAVAGQRTAVNLAVPREAIERGATLVRPGTVPGTVLFDARLHILLTANQPLPRRTRVLLHAGTAQRLAQVTLLDRGEVAPGQSGLAQIQVPTELTLLPGDRFILRGFALQRHHTTTLGGGVVLRTQPVRHRRGSPALLARLAEVERALGDSTPEGARILVQEAVDRAGVRGLSLSELLALLPIHRRRVESALQHLTSTRRIVGLCGRDSAPIYASHQALALVQEAVLAAVREHHARAPLQPGLAREALSTQIRPLGGDRDGVGEGRPQVPSARLLQRALEGLLVEGRLQMERDLLKLPGHDPTHAVAGSQSLAERVEGLYRQAGLAPPRPDEAAGQLALPLTELRFAVELLVRKGVLVRVRDLLFHHEAIDDLRRRLVDFLRERREITLAQWKDMVGQTRKYAIPLAEYFDAERVTLRVGDVRRLRG